MGGGGKMVEVIWENRFRERERVGRIFGWRFRMIEKKREIVGFGNLTVIPIFIYIVLVP